jgi:hypothetical protein
MPMWLILAALGAIGATALLTAVLWRINLPLVDGQATERQAPDPGDGGGE